MGYVKYVVVVTTLFDGLNNNQCNQDLRSQDIILGCNLHLYWKFKCSKLQVLILVCAIVKNVFFDLEEFKTITKKLYILRNVPCHYDIYDLLPTFTYLPNPTRATDVEKNYMSSCYGKNLRNNFVFKVKM